MDRRTLLAGLATTGSLGLAGCTGEDGFFDDGAGPVGDDDDDGPPEDAAWADGDGLDVEELESAHVEAVVDTGSFTVESVADTSHSGEERPSEWLFAQTLTSAFDQDTHRQSLVHDLTEVDERTDVYVTDERAYYRQVVDGETQYDVQPIDRSDEEYRVAMEDEARTGILGLGSWNLSFVGSTETAGRAAYRYEGDTFTGERDVPASIEEAGVTAVIDDRGVVHRIEETYAGDHEEQTVEVAIIISYEDIGDTTVEEPDWLTEAREQTDD